MSIRVRNEFRQPHRWFKIFARIFIIIILLVIYIFVSGNVDKKLDSDSIKIVRSMNLDNYCKKNTLRGIYACASAAQHYIADKIPDHRCAARGQSIEPSAFFSRGYGCCYDRARLLGRVFKYYGINTRRVAIYHDHGWGILALAMPGIDSHATIEVKTPEGWMGVDSNETFILRRRDGRPVRYVDLQNPFVKDKLEQQPRPGWFYDAKYVVVYGLYSRHGMFHGRNLPGPEINFPDFFAYNF